MTKYYKLYSLDNKKLRSKFGELGYIKLNQPYKAADLSLKLSFASIDNILDFLDGFYGYVICDIEPVGKVIDSSPNNSKVESRCDCIIAKNPRSVYSPEFIQELIIEGKDNAWKCITNQSYVLGAIEHFNDGICYGFNLNYELYKSLKFLLLDSYDNIKLNEKFENYRKRYDYERILKSIRNDQASQIIVVNAWDKYAPNKKSKLLKFFSFVIRDNQICNIVLKLIFRFIIK